MRLLNRTTRRIGLTPDGAGYYQHCVRILADVEETEACFQEAALRLKGRLRIDVPTCIGRLILIPSLCDFHDKYPDVELVLGLGDRPVDMVQEAVDCVIRSGDLEDSSLVARRIGMLQTVTCASPSYISRHGMPQTIEELGRHHAVHYFMSRSGRNCAWNFKVDDKHQEVEMKGTVAVNEAGGLPGLRAEGFWPDPDPALHGAAAPAIGRADRGAAAVQARRRADVHPLPAEPPARPRCAPSPTGWPSCSPAARC